MKSPAGPGDPCFAALPDPDVLIRSEGSGAPSCMCSLDMNAAHESALRQEVRLARELMERGDFDGAFLRLERAHNLGQAHVRWHVLAHWLMLEVAIRRHQGIAALGQAVRIVLGAIGSAVGRVPTGVLLLSRFWFLPAPSASKARAARSCSRPSEGLS
jgi:hypothetical protein